MIQILTFSGISLFKCMYFINEMLSQEFGRDDRMAKLLPVQALGPESEPQHVQKKPGM